jgi:hypothetical protein
MIDTTQLLERGRRWCRVSEVVRCLRSPNHRYSVIDNAYQIRTSIRHLANIPHNSATWLHILQRRRRLQVDLVYGISRFNVTQTQFGGAPASRLVFTVLSCGASAFLSFFCLTSKASPRDEQYGNPRDTEPVFVPRRPRHMKSSRPSQSSGFIERTQTHLAVLK